MKILLEEKDKTLLREILENLPEYACYSHLRCTKWKYDACLFTFLEDVEDNGCSSGAKEHVLDEAKAMKGLQMYFDKVAASSSDNSGDFSGSSLSNIMDAGNWDASMVDCLVQLALLGEVVYG